MTHPAAADLRARLAAGRALGERLLTSDERHVLAAVDALDDDSALLLARLHPRRPGAFRVPDLTCPGVHDPPAAVASLVDAGLATFDVLPELAASEATVAVLTAACRRLGLPTTGRRDALAARLAPVSGWDDARWIRLLVRDVLLRVERWGTLQVEPDRAAPVLERLGRRRGLEAPVTGGSLVPRRSAWDLAERLLGASLTPEVALAALAWPDRPPGGLDPAPGLVDAVRRAAEAAEAGGSRATATAWLDALDRVRPGSTTTTILRSRLRERDGDPSAALDVLVAAREVVDGPGRRALDRSARRLARRLGRPWSPEAPGPPPVVRSIRLDRSGRAGIRPTYGGRLVEDAVAARVSAAGRAVVGGEGALASTLLTALALPLVVAPVPGQLPVPRLPGPLDLGTPAFAARRAALGWELVDGVAAGEGPKRVEAGAASLVGVTARGVEPSLVDPPTLAAVAEGLGPTGLGVLVRAWLAGGRRALRGLPDLWILPGAEAQVDGLLPSRLPSGLVLVEVKGEQDTVRDAQAWWFDVLAGAGVRIERWEVAASAASAVMPSGRRRPRVPDGS